MPLGDEVALDPSSGMRYSIKWGQDEAGNLQVLRWAPLNGGEVLGLPQPAANGSAAPPGAAGSGAAVELARQ